MYNQMESILQITKKCNTKTTIHFGKGKKHCEKRKKCWLPAFSPVPLLFTKGLFSKVIKTMDYMIKSQQLDLTLYYTIPTTLRKRPLENIVGKGGNAGYQHFLLFLQCFRLFLNQISIFDLHNFFCCLQMLPSWTILKFCLSLTYP